MLLLKADFAWKQTLFETQVQSKIVSNSMNGTIMIRGYAMSPEELPCQHDVYMTIRENYDQQTTSYILQFCGEI